MAAANAGAGRTAWVRNLDTPLRSFLRTETGSAAILLAATVTALLWVNLDQAGYDRLWRTELAVRLGDTNTRGLYVVLLVLPFVLLPFMAGLGERPLAALGFVALILARRPIVAVLGGARGPQLIAVLGDTGKVQMVYGLLVAIGFLIGG